MVHHLARATKLLIVGGIITVALVLTAIRFTLGVITIYTEDLERILTQSLGAPVRIGHLGAGIRGFRPELVLKNVQVLGATPTQVAPLSVQEIRLSMNLLHSYGQQELLNSSWMTLVGLKLTVLRQADGRITVEGLPANDDSKPPTWLLQTAQIEVLNSQLTWRDQLQSVSATPALQSSANSNKSPIGVISLPDVNAVLKSDEAGRRHLVNVVARLPKPYGEALSLSMQLRGNFLAPDGLNGLIYLDGKQLQLGKWLSSMPLPLAMNVTAGQGNVRLWSYWQQSQLRALTGTTQLAQVKVQRPAQPPLVVKAWRNQFNWLQQGEQWTLRVDNWDVNAAQLQLDDTRLLLRGNRTTNVLQELALQTPHLEVQQLAQTAAFFGVTEGLGIPAQVVQGQLRDVSLMVAPMAERFSIKAGFEQVSLQAQQAIPGIGNISGTIEGDQQHGVLDIRTSNTALAMPDIFPAALPIEALQGRFEWQQQPDAWLLSTSNLSAQVPDLQADSQLQFKVDRASHAVWMDLQTAFKGDTDIQSFGRYWPTGLMGKDAADWLKQAFLKGRVTPRGALFSGALAEFPFAQKQGVFELLLGFSGVDLRYAPEWGAVQGIDADVRFYNAGLTVQATRASVLGVPLKQFDVAVDSFETSPFIGVTVQGEGDITHTLAYLQQSPIKSPVERVMHIIKPHGLAPIHLAIQVPIVGDAPVTVQGDLNLHEVGLEVLPIGLPVNRLVGGVHFNEHGIQEGQLHGQTLSGDIEVVLRNTSKALQLDVSGHTDVLDVQQQFGVPLWRYARGDSDYHVNLNLPNTDAAGTVTVSSDLRGVALKLPDSLAKTAQESRASSIHVNLVDAGLMPVTVRMGNVAQAAAMLNTTTKKAVAANVILGAGALGPMPEKGGELRVNLAQCTLADWMDLSNGVSNPDSTAVPFFTSIRLQAKQSLWQGQALGALNVQMDYAQQLWRVGFDHPLLQGQLTTSTDTQQDKPVQIDLDSINLSGLAHLKAAEAPQHDNKPLPLFNLTAKRVLWDGVNVGDLTIETNRIAAGVAFKTFRLTNPRGSLDLTGNWTVNAGQQMTNINGTVGVRGFGAFLSDMAISTDVQGTDAQVDLTLDWRGAPHHFALERLHGRVGIELTNGRILSIEPGFGRLLGFLAFEQWGRRLRLDFSDMLAEGLTFNRIHGHFDLANGKALTDNLTVDAVPATVNINGVANLAARTLEYRAKVLPKSSAALPIAGTIVDRISTFTLETITGNSQEGFLLGSEYKIIGAWDNPQVIRLRESDGLLQKTWYGLTDFSWL